MKLCVVCGKPTDNAVTVNTGDAVLTLPCCRYICEGFDLVANAAVERPAPDPVATLQAAWLAWRKKARL